jgi:putative membrane protein
MRTVATAVMVAALAFAPAVTLAQTSAPRASDKGTSAEKGRATRQSALTSDDRQFVVEALRGSLAEVELGKLAAEKASSDAVKQFGQRMVEDHGKAGEELKKIAQDKGIDPPTRLDGKHQKLRDSLAKRSGADFDRAYAGEMVKDHRKDVKDFQRQAERARDPDVKGFAAKTLPTLQDHLKDAESMQAKVTGSAKTEKK